MTIHSVYILSNAGVCLYSRNYSEEFEFDVNLLTPFFSAILSFSKNLINRELDELEISGLRFVFKTKDNFIFVMLADTTDSILFISSRLLRMVDVFYQLYNQIEDILKDSIVIENIEFDNNIDSILTGEEDFSQRSVFYLKVIDFFQRSAYENEILGAALLSGKGNLIYTSLPSEVLMGAIKEFEIRFMTGALHLPELYYMMEKGQKVFSMIIEHKTLSHYFLVLYFDKDIPMGLARRNTLRVAKEMKNIITDFS